MLDRFQRLTSRSLRHQTRDDRPVIGPRIRGSTGFHGFALRNGSMGFAVEWVRMKRFGTIRDSGRWNSGFEVMDMMFIHLPGRVRPSCLAPGVFDLGLHMLCSNGFAFQDLQRRSSNQFRAAKAAIGHGFQAFWENRDTQETDLIRVMCQACPPCWLEFLGRARVRRTTGTAAMELSFVAPRAVAPTTRAAASGAASAAGRSTRSVGDSGR